MSEFDTKEKMNSDDRAILVAWARVMAAGTDVPLPAGTEESQVREYVELLGLLPYELEPAAPPADVKERLLSRIRVSQAAVETGPEATGESAAGDPAASVPIAGDPAELNRSFDEVTFAADSEDPIDMTFRRPLEPFQESPSPEAMEPPSVQPAASPAASSASGIQPPQVVDTPVFETPMVETPRVQSPVEPTTAEPTPSVEATAIESPREIEPALPASPFQALTPPDPAPSEPKSAPNLEAPTPEVAPSAEPLWPQPLATEPTARPATPAPEAPAPTSFEPPAPAASPAPAAALQPPAEVVPMPMPAPAQRPSMWTYALAAMLAVCMMGLAYLSGKLQQQAGTIARLNTQMQVLPVQDLSSLSTELTTMRQRFHMVTAIARQAYPMEMVQARPGVQTDGVVYVCGQHQRWYMNVQGLEKPPAGQQYNLWFVTEQGMVDGGKVNVRQDASSELEAQSMPDDTRGFAVTLEDTGAIGSEPKGAMVLLAEEAVSL